MRAGSARDLARGTVMAKKRRRGQARHPRVSASAREDWGVALEVDAVVQSVSVPAPEGACELDGADEPRPGPGGGYWGLMLPPGCPKRALLLGLGGGTVAHLLARRCPDVAMVGVERNPEVIAVARARFGLDALPTLAVVEADAFTWVADQAASGEDYFDLICMDLFEAGRLALGTLATPFLRQVGALLAPEGVLTVNLMVTGRTPEQLHRLRRVFRIVSELRLRGNLVIHAMLDATATDGE